MNCKYRVHQEDALLHLTSMQNHLVHLLLLLLLTRSGFEEGEGLKDRIEKEAEGSTRMALIKNKYGKCYGTLRSQGDCLVGSSACFVWACFKSLTRNRYTARLCIKWFEQEQEQLLT